MTPKEKAKKLFDKMYWHFRTIADKDICKECVLIAVDEIINECGDRFLFSKCDFWQEVKEEIEKL